MLTHFPNAQPRHNGKMDNKRFSSSVAKSEIRTQCQNKKMQTFLCYLQFCNKSGILSKRIRFELE